MVLNSIDAGNRETSQGSTYSFEHEPATQFATITAVPSGSAYAVGEKVVVTQWKVSAHLVKTYRYVGLSKAAAEALAAAIAGAYVVNVPQYTLGIDGNDISFQRVYKYLPVEGVGMPTCCASVTPVHADGPLWNIEVAVDATVVKYLDDVPSFLDIKTWFTAVDSFPEGSKTYNTQTGAVT